jgi:hypothetical protein
VPEFLYRALRPEEIECGRLIPKRQTPFLAEPRLKNVLPFNLGFRVEHAARDHQDTKETSGISTSPHLFRAEFYAQRHRRIARIRVEELHRFGIQQVVVAEHVHATLINKPEDDEVVLVRPDVQEFPSQIIDRIVEFVPGHITNFEN